MLSSASAEPEFLTVAKEEYQEWTPVHKRAETATMRVLPRTKRAIWTALAVAVLFLPVSALAQAGSESGLDISLEDGRITMNVRDASPSRVLRAIADKGGFVLDISGQLDSKVSLSFENIPIERAFRRIVGRSSYIIELVQSTSADAPRRIGKLSVFARGAPTKPTKRRKSSSTKPKQGKPSATKTKR